MTKQIIRWRLNDPAVEMGRERWTLVHTVSRHAADLTVCHRIIPEFPYMADRDGYVPADAMRCRQCARGEE